MQREREHTLSTDDVVTEGINEVLPVTDINTPERIFFGEEFEIGVTIQNQTGLIGSIVNQSYRVRPKLLIRTLPGTTRTKIGSEVELKPNEEFTWPFDIEYPEDLDNMEIEVVVQYLESSTDSWTDIVGQDNTITLVGEKEPSTGEKAERILRTYGPPAAFGSAVGAGLAETYEEPFGPIVLASGSTAVGLQYTGQRLQDSLSRMNLPVWSIWGVALTTLSGAIIIGQITG